MLPPDLRELEKRLEELDARGRGGGTGQDYERAAQLQGAEPTRSRRRSSSRQGRLAGRQGHADATVTADDIAELVSKWTGIPVQRMLAGGGREAARTWRRSCTSASSARTGRSTAVARRDPPRPRGPQGPEAADRLVHLPRPDGRRQDRAGPRAGRVPVRRRGRADPPRHVRVHGEAHRRRGSSARRPATSATTRAASSPRRCGGARTASSSSTRSRRRTRTCSTRCCRSSTTAG